MKWYPKDVKSSKTALVLVWPDCWRSCREGQGKGQLFPTGMLSCKEKKDASASTDHVVFCAMEDGQWRLCPGSSPHQWLWSKVSWHTVGASSGTSARHSLAWVTLSLTAPLGITANPGCCDHQPICFPRPWHLVLCCSCAVKGTHRCCFTLRNIAATYECDDCAGLGTGRGNLVLPGSPCLDLLYPRRTGAPLQPLLSQGCVAMPLTSLHLFTDPL